MLLGLLSISLYCLHKEFGYAIKIGIVLEAIRHSKSWMHERAGKENESAGCADAMNSGSSDDLCLSFVSTEVYGGEGGYTWKGKNMCHDRYKDWRMILLVYILLFLPLVS